MRRALITGAAGGLGRALAKEAAARGYTLVMTDRDADALRAAVDPFPGSEIIVADLRSRTDRAELCERIASDADPVDLLVNNAGYDHGGLASELSDEVMTAYAEVNLVAPMVLSAAAARAMTRRGDGDIFAIGSLGALYPMKGSAAYSGTKFGLRGFSAALRLELDGTDVSVGAIYPSAIDTPMLEREMSHPSGSPLNFVGGTRPLSAEAVARRSFEAIAAKRLETWLPPGEGRLANLVMTFPGTLVRVNRWLERQGNRKKIMYLESLGIETK